MLVNDYGEAIAAGGWSTPAGCCRAPSGTNFGGSVPSLHPTGSLRSLRSHHSVQGPVETPRRCLHCHPVNNPIHASYLQHQQQLLLQQHHRQHQQHQQQTHQHPQYYTPNHHDEQNGTHVPQRNGSYHYRNDRGVDYRGDRDPRLRSADVEESIAGHTNWGLDDLRSLHRCVPALRRPGIDVAGMRAHFYPEGGWGWLVCAAGFLALLLTTGMQLAFGLLHLYAARHLGENHLMDIAWVGALSAAVSRGSAPLVVGACRRGSTRLTAVIGGLVLALASLFTSFAVQMHQVLLSFLNELNSRAACGMLMNFALNMAYLWIVYKLNPSAECSYGLVLGAGAGLVKETAGLVLGHYFRKRREFVEMVVQAGTGVGIALFSVFYREAVGKLGWRLGLQSVTGALSLAFFLGLVYRSASLYHPQRRAILHLKNQQSKVKERKPALRTPRQPLVDLSPLGSRPVRMLMLAAGAAGFGLYSPAFYIALQGYQDGLEASALVLLQTCLGLAAALGCAGWGVITARPSAQCLVSRQYLCQAALIGVAVAQVALGSVQGYHGLVLASGLYGASLGGVLYSLKMLALERLRARHFSRAWALVQAAEALPILLGVPLTGYMNASSPRVGYYACTLSSLSGAALLFLVGWGRHPSSPALGPPPPPCACPPPPRPRLPKSQSLHVPLAIDVDDDAIPQPMELPGYFHPHFHGTLRPSKSYPEGLSYPEFYRTRPRAHRDVTVIEQITTSV